MLSASVRDRFDPTVSNRPNRSSRRIAVPEHAFPCRFVCADVTARCMSVPELLPSFSLGPSNRRASEVRACNPAEGAREALLGSRYRETAWDGPAKFGAPSQRQREPPFERFLGRSCFRLLSDFSRQGASVSDVAKALGFSELSAFTHAFRRWSGETPSSWKLRHAPPKAERPRKAQGPRRTTRQGEARRRP